MALTRFRRGLQYAVRFVADMWLCESTSAKPRLESTSPVSLCFVHNPDRRSTSGLPTIHSEVHIGGSGVTRS